MPLELNLHFPDPRHVTISLISDHNHEETELIDFNYPFSDKDYQQIRWYLEKYATPYSTEIDFDNAGRIVNKLPFWGNALFYNALPKRAARRLFKKFQNHKELGRLLTITADHPAILSLPWELMHHPMKGGNFLISEVPRISIRRRLPGLEDRKAFQIHPKQQSHLLFVLSRPTNADFIDPRANIGAVLTALDKRALNRVTVEFLRPATLKNLRNRLENKELPHVDILHFDGHCIFDKDGHLENEARAGFETLSADLKKITTTIKMDKHIGYLLFENNNSEKQLVPAALLANLLNRQQVPLVILSGCQSVGIDMNNVAARLTIMGIPFVLAMSASMMVPATQKFFETFYDGLAQGHGIGTVLDAARLSLYQDTGRREIQRLKDRVKIHLHDWFLPALYQRGQDAALLTQISPEKIQFMQKNLCASSSNLPQQQLVGFFGRQRELWQIEHWFMRGTRRITISGFGGQGKTCLAQEAGRWLHHSRLFSSVVFVDYANYQGIDPVSMAVSAIANVLQKNLLDADAATEALRRVPTLLIFDNVDSLISPHPSKVEANSPNNHVPLVENGISAPLEDPFFKDNSQSFDPNGEQELLIIDNKDNNDLIFDDNEKNVFKVEEYRSEGEKDAEEGNHFILDEDEHQVPIFNNKAFSVVGEDSQDKAFKEEILDKKKTEAPYIEENQTAANNKKEDDLQKLLDAAKKWSDAGQSRVIIITRHPYLHHTGFLKNGIRHNQLSLDNLGEKEALRYFEALMVLPPKPAYGIPKRAAVEQLFKTVGYHPLSIKIIAFQLKNDSLNTLSQRLDALLRELPADMPQSEKSQQASLNLFLRKLEPQMRPYLLKLGVFKDGAFENVLQSITHIPNDLWQTLRQTLETSGLIQVENLDGVTVPYFKFEAALAPLLWAQLSSSEQQALVDRYCQGYYEFSNFLYDEDKKNTYQTRAIEQRELPNLLHALYSASDRGKSWATKFTNQVKLFLVDFGLKSNRPELLAVADNRVAPKNSPNWFKNQSNLAEQFYTACKYQDAQTAFQEILEQLGDTPSCDRCVALGWLGRCLAEQGQIDDGIYYFRQALAELDELESSPQIRQEICYMQTYLATVLKDKGDYSGAKQAYEAALPILKAIGDTRNEAIIEDQLGSLEILQGDLPKAERHHRKALSLFQQLNQPKLEANVWHNLGMVYQKAKQWQAAASAYQKAANRQDDLAKAASSWYQFALASQTLGNLTEAKNGYHKAIEGYKAVENWLSVAIGLRNLAELLHNQPQSLDEARQFAEAGLAIDKTLDPNVAEIWQTYTLLANIAEKQNDVAQAKIYRGLAQQTQVNSAQEQNKLRQHQQFIDAVVATVAQPELGAQLESMLRQREAKGWTKLVASIRRILEGERDCESLCDDDNLDLTDSFILRSILQKVENKAK